MIIMHSPVGFAQLDRVEAAEPCLGSDIRGVYPPNAAQGNVGPIERSGLASRAAQIGCPSCSLSSDSFDLFQTFECELQAIARCCA